MKKLSKHMPLLLVTAAFIGFSQPLFADETAPVLLANAVGNTNISITISNLAAGATYHLEQTDTLFSNDWNEVYRFEGRPGETNWTSTTGNSGFYRAIQDLYHPKVGQSASLDTPGHHLVSGSAHIVNNRTIELRDFNFDGGGIVVEVWVSPNTTFDPYISISEDLFGTAFTNATVVLELPEGTDLDTLNYISIWCVGAGLSFGDGPFQ